MNIRTKTWRPNALLVLFSILLLIVVIDACRKMDKDVLKPENPDKPVTVDAITKKFFTVPASTDPLVKAIAESMRKHNDTMHFAEPLSKRAGWPIWDKAKVQTTAKALRTEGGEEEDTTIVTVPYGLANNVTAVMTVAINIFHEKDTAYNMLYPNQYINYGFDTVTPKNSWNARTHFKMFADFSKDAYGIDSFMVYDGRIFGQGQYDTLSVEEDNGANESEYFYYDCTTFRIMLIRCMRGVNTENQPGEWTVESCISAYVDGGSGYNRNEPGPLAPFGGGSGSEEGGGGGGGAPAGLEDLSNIDPCPAQERMHTDLAPHVLNPCNSAPWVPATPAAVYNPYRADTIGITSGLQNVFPCAYAFIHDSFPNANLLAQLASGEVFKDSIYMHLYFDTSTVYTQPGQRSGNTRSDSVRVDGDGITHYRATITLNPWYLRHGTKEYMVSTIIHEMMHACFTLRWGQYQQWLQWGPPNAIDSGWLKDHYKIYWNIYTGQNIPLTDYDDHEIMATDYFTFFSNTVKYYYNPAAPQAIKDSVVKALCYGGLDNTTAWAMLPSLGMDTCKYRAIQVTAERSLIGTYNTGCGNFVAHYADSLKMRSSCN